jgi:hypothetical protein
MCIKTTMQATQLSSALLNNQQSYTTYDFTFTTYFNHTLAAYCKEIVLQACDDAPIPSPYRISTNENIFTGQRFDATSALFRQ